ncbi:MAG: formylglycine-generating enzyme family protein, partial [Bacteroidaceae bacterium]
SNEQPVHSVTITKDYYIGETEVTQALWKAVMGYSPTSDGIAWSSSDGLGDDYPAYLISYEDVQSFITKLNILTGQKFRMPTEAEWEFAARGGNKSKGYTYSGSNTIDDVAWYGDNSNHKTHPVKTKAANELGIYDMSGNVYEWCNDWYGSDYYSSSPQNNPTGPATGSYRVRRGGSWYSDAASCRCAYRSLSSLSYRGNDLGVRLSL